MPASKYDDFCHAVHMADSENLGHRLRVVNRCGNVAAVLAFDENLNREFKMFREVPESEFGSNPERRTLVPYFL